MEIHMTIFRPLNCILHTHKANNIKQQSLILTVFEPSSFASFTLIVDVILCVIKGIKTGII